MILLSALSVSAESALDIELYAGDGFYTYADKAEAVAEILNMPESELEKYLTDNGIAYIAVNSDNSKQIKVTEAVTDFSSGVINLSGLSDDKITELVPNITGIDGIRGEIVNRNGQKFIKTELSSSDSGGNYLLTEYITVADRTLYTLSFCTAASCDTGYITEVFESFTCPDFISNTASKGNAVYYIVITAAVLFAASSAAVAVWIIFDILKEKKLNR